MQKFNWSLDRHDADEAETTPEVTDAVAAIVGQFEATESVPIVVAAPVSSPVVAAADTPALTRRELRERAAKPAPRPTLFTSAPAAATSAATGPGSTAASSRTAPKMSSRKVKASARKLNGLRAKASRPVPKVSSNSKRPSLRHRVLSKLATFGAMAGVGLILIATTVPANAFVRPDGSAMSATASSNTAQTQELKVEGATAAAVSRDAYTVISLQQQVQAKYGNRVFTYTNNPNGTIQWPFATGVPITSGFGPRHVSGCGYCSTYHQGLDFTPGAGAPIQSIADGVVSLVEVSNSGLGNHVIIDHVINGQKVQSVYAHMQYGSIKVAVGQTVTVAQQIGNVGSTGASTGAHLHLEIHLDGTPVDPFAWLQANAN